MWACCLLVGKPIEVLIDAEDLARVAPFNWRARRLHPDRPNGGYVYVEASLGGGKNVSLHRFVIDPPAGMLVDHRNHNTCDNRKANLRVCTRSQNCGNTRVSRANSFGLKGVSHEGKRFKASIVDNGRKRSLGTYATPEEAHEAYRHAAVKVFGEFACFGTSTAPDMAIYLPLFPPAPNAAPDAVVIAEEVPAPVSTPGKAPCVRCRQSTALQLLHRGHCGACRATLSRWSRKGHKPGFDPRVQRLAA